MKAFLRAYGVVVHGTMMAAALIAFDRNLLTKKQPHPDITGLWLFRPGELESSIRLGYSQCFGKYYS